MTQPAQESFWGALGEAQITTRGRKLSPGHYKLELGDAILKQTREHGPCFIVDQTVLESDNPDFPFGAKTSFFQKMQHQNVAHREIKRFILNVLGYDTSIPEHQAWITANIDAKPDLFMQGVVEGSMKGLTVAVLGTPIWTKPKEGRTSVHVCNVEYQTWHRPEDWQPNPTPAVAAVAQHAGPCPYGAQQTALPGMLPGQQPMNPQAAFVQPAGAPLAFPVPGQQPAAALAVAPVAAALAPPYPLR